MKKYLITLLILACACSRSENNDPQTLVIGLSNGPTTLDPRIATDANSQRLSDLIFSALVRNGPDLKPVAQLASSWKIEKNKITFSLRSDIQFHHGRPVTAEDVVYSVNQARKPSSPFASAFAAVQGVETRGLDKVVFTLTRDDAPLMTNLNDVKILPRDLIEKDPAGWAAKPVGSGPYQFVSLDTNQIILKKAATPSHDSGRLEKMVFKFVRDDNTRYLKILKGDLDILSNELPEDKIIELKKSDKVAVVISPGLNMNYLLLNLKTEALKNLKFRQALFSSLDRDQIVNFKLEGLATVASSILAPSNPFAFEGKALPPLPLDKAKALVKELGLAGNEFSLKTSEQAVANGQVLASQMEQLGIKIKLQSFEWATYYGDVKSGNYQMALMRWVGIVDPDVYRDTLASTQFPPGRNRGYYSNKEFDGLVEAARKQNDFSSRRNLYLKAQQIIINELPILPLWYNSNISVVSKRVKNFTPIITGSFYPFLGVTKE